ncbi:LOW QUALITY PROTEIN: spermatogenic leucine zipper protein 1 [Mesocricetus auratus]|uniref:LOW QUALITY PROTEIN: spermatogenic leucine zipper protein 1 n=1 Tax=Mesocricetus auratus TaxID=10036 RepID=A0A1U7Q6G2_MESAU|nr:LOW QUALITY PROTEIN: spermatogenic leucine zipper protein 1 [Mesocricetus auratus]
MASCDSSAERPAPPQTPNPTPCVKQGPPGPPNPGITISLLEIGSLPPFCWGSLPPPKDSIRPLERQGMVQKFSNLLKDIKDVLKSIAGGEEMTTEVRESFDDAYTSEDMSDPKIRGVGKRNKTRFRDMLINVHPEKEWNIKKQEMILNSQSARKMMQGYARDRCSSEEKRDCDGMHLNIERGHYGSFHIRGEYRRLRNNMEQLLQETDHWSRQHNELSEIMKSYQECQKERRDTLEKIRVHYPTQPNKELSTKQELEEQVKKLSHDTHSLHLIAALLENECQILQHRVDILREYHLHEAGPQHSRPLQMHCVQDRKCQKFVEADRTEGNNKQNPKVTEGVLPRKEKISRNSDACLTKKARNNRFNSRIARKALLGKRRTLSSFR